MCGIGGVQFKNSIVRQEFLHLNQFEDSLASEQSYRGPDFFGKFSNIELNTYLYHNRLSIMDLSAAANQPMFSADDKIAIVFNGEIFNWRDLKSELEKKGYSFRTTSDTEVLLNLYLEFGVELLAKIQGMFSFAIFDMGCEQIFLARDSIGKKPLFYNQSTAGFAFASSISPLKRFLNNQVTISQSSISTFFLPNFRHVPEPLSGYEQIRKVRPGHALLVRGGEIVKEWRHFHPSFVKSTLGNEPLDDIIRSSVLRRIDADVPVSALLSGGLDSSLIVALMRDSIKDELNTFVLGLDENDLDVRRSRFVANRLGTKHHVYFFEPDLFFEIFKKIIHECNEPICLLPLVYTYVICSKIRENGIKVALTGHGADELFAGYTGYRRLGIVSKALSTPGFGKVAKYLLPLVLDGATRSDIEVPGIRKWKLRRDFGRHRFLKNAQVFNYLVDEYEVWERCLEEGATFLDESLFYSLMYENQHSLQFAADFPAMLASVEVRSPFLDERVIEYAFKLPDADKVGYFCRLNDLKSAVRKLSSRYLDSSIINFEKRGFGNGISEEYLLNGPWRTYIDEYFRDLVDPSGIFDLDELRKSWTNFKQGIRVANDAQDLLKVVSLQIWFRNL